MQCLGQTVPPAVAKCLGQGPVVKKKGAAANKRAGVSAEAGGGRDDESAEIKVYSKSDTARQRLRTHTEGKTLFAGMTEEQHEAVIDAMFEVHCKPAQVIIAQGDMVCCAFRLRAAAAWPACQLSGGRAVCLTSGTDRLAACLTPPACSTCLRAARLPRFGAVHASVAPLALRWAAARRRP